MIDQLAHFLIPLIALLPVALWPGSPDSWVWAAFVYAVYREDAQHRIAGDAGWGWPFQGGGRWIDIAVGTAPGLAIGLWVRFG